MSFSAPGKKFVKLTKAHVAGNVPVYVDSDTIISVENEVGCSVIKTTYGVQIQVKESSEQVIKQIGGAHESEEELKK